MEYREYAAKCQAHAKSLINTSYYYSSDSVLTIGIWFEYSPQSHCLLHPYDTGKSASDIPDWGKSRKGK